MTLEQFKKILILMPHPDDEVLLSGGIIFQGLQLNKQVKVVLATTGDYDAPHREIGKKRMLESIAACKLLGLSENKLIFMGYPDTGMSYGNSFLYNLFLEQDAYAIHDGKAGRSTYGPIGNDSFHELWTGEAGMYTRTTFKEDLKQILMNEQADAIFTTSEYDLHGDHVGLFWFLQDALAEIPDYSPTVYTGIVHSFDGDDNWPLRNHHELAFSEPKTLAETDFIWSERKVFPMLPEMLAEPAGNLKAQALASHVTAMKPDDAAYLSAFVKNEEIFWEVGVK
ncbi:PIG-L deacetylase family protein [Enterococcus sp. LJL120]